MSQKGASTFYIVCSDQPRNGKTLVARLLCDYLILCRRSPLIFDAASAPGGLRSYYPARATKVEMSTTPGQIALFDRALAQPLHDSVVELPAHLLTTVADLMRQIGFGEKSHTPSLDMVILFIADRSVDSLLAGRTLRASLRPARFIMVKNEAILATPFDRMAKFLYDGLAKDGQIVVPVLDPAVTALIEDKTFSFRRFAEDVPEDMPQHLCLAVEALLSRVFRQFHALGLGTNREPRAAAGN